MFTGFDERMIPFLIRLRLENSKEYYVQHKSEYEEWVKKPYDAFIDALAPTVLAIDPDMEVRPRKCLSRIYRDLRFSKDKNLYRDHHWISFQKCGRPRDGALFFWFEIRPGGASWGTGFWGECRPAMTMLRARMAARPDEMLALLDHVGDAAHLGGERFKRMAYPDGLPEALKPIYASKSLYFETGTSDIPFALSRDILPAVQSTYRALAPLYLYLLARCDEALESAQAAPKEEG